MRRRSIFFPLFLGVFTFFGFLRTPGADHVRPVQIATLIATGMCIGVALAHLIVQLNARSQD